MADIKKELNDIKNAVYGKEVRGSIHDGIKKINDEVENATDLSESAKHQVENIQQQVNQLVVEGDSSVEAAQARVDEKGVVHPTLKARIDNGMNSVNQQLAQTKKVINVHAYGATGNGDDYTDAIQQAIDDSDNEEIYLPSGVYRLRQLVTNGKSVTLKGDGMGKTILIQTENKPIIKLRGGWDEVVQVIGYDEVDLPLEPGSSTMRTVHKLQLSKNAELQEGDVIKVFSDDIIPHSMAPEHNRRSKGEFAVVLKSDGANVYLTSKLTHTYETNIRVSRIENHTFNISDFTVDTDLPADYSGRTQEMIHLSSAVNCKISRIDSVKGRGTFLFLNSLFGYSVTNVYPNRLTDDDPNDHRGYGIQDSVSENGVISDCSFYRSRHGFTTNGVEPVGDDPSTYGYSANITLNNCHSFGANSSGFDTHPECYNIVFNNCTSVKTFNAGFSARGNYVYFNNCISNGDRTGFFVSREGTNNVHLNDCHVIGAIQPYQIYDSTNVYIDNATHSGTGQVLSIYRSENVSIKNTSLKLLGTGQFQRLINIIDSSVSVKGGVFDLSDHTGTSLRAIQLSNSTVTVIGTHFEVDAAKMNAYVVQEGNNTSNAFIFNYTTNEPSVNAVSVTGYREVVRSIDNRDYFATTVRVSDGDIIYHDLGVVPVVSVTPQATTNFIIAVGNLTNNSFRIDVSTVDGQPYSGELTVHIIGVRRRELS